MLQKQTEPLGIELAKRKIITEDDIQRALEYQKNFPRKKLGDIINILKLCDSQLLINAIGEILGENAILLKTEDMQLNITDYISIDIAKRYKAIPFSKQNGKVKVCFADTSDEKAIDKIRLLLLNRGLIMEKYITFESDIDKILATFEGTVADKINPNMDITALLDTIIKTAMEKRASDIHIEPLEDRVRIRYRIDGNLITAVTLDKEKQQQLIGRLKAISNMHEEKQEAQDGRIISYPAYNIRVSSQKNIYGEKFVLRLLKKNSTIKKVYELGFPEDEKLLNECFNKRNCVTIIAAPTGEGKTTTLYSIINHLNRPEVNITTIEDPVEIRIPGLNQIEIDSKISFSDSLRTALRQDPNIILVGEIRDKETAEIAMQAGQTGHYVLSTIHTIDSIGVITRLRKLGLSNYDMSETLATAVSQRLVRRVCPHCAKQRDFSEDEINIMTKIANKYKVKLNFTNKKTFDITGCEKCNYTGYYDRIGIFEVLIIDDEIRKLISQNAPSEEIRKQALKGSYKPLVIDGIKKVLSGITTLDELNDKLAIY